MRVRDTLGISSHRQAQLSRAMQVALGIMVLYGIYKVNLGIVVNAGIGFGVTYLPAILRRDYRIPMDAGLTLWITAAVFLHALGATGIPWITKPFYGNVPGWDHVTHVLSASVVAAVGYTTARAIDEHTEEVYLPRRFMFVFILLFTMAFGVLWEVIEFSVSQIAAMTGSTSVLTQYGLEDTMYDLVFDTLGGVIVAVWGAAYLSNVADALAARLDRSRA